MQNLLAHNMLPEQSTTTVFSNLRQKIENTNSLPVMPQAAKILLQLAHDPHSHMNEFVEIIETDPSLSAQLIRFSRSAFFNYQGKIESIRHVVSNVLGFKRTLDIALSLSVGRMFKIESHGPLGLQTFWRNAVYSAVFMEQLAEQLDDSANVDTNMAFMCGLMHNFGVLVIGHLFPHEALLMNQIIKANPKLPLAQVEKQVMNITHNEAGSILLKHWNLPEAIVTCAAHHHSDIYIGPNAHYIKLQQITDIMLDKLDISDIHGGDVLRSQCRALRIEPETAESVLQWIHPQQENLSQLANALVA